MRYNRLVLRSSLSIGHFENDGVTIPFWERARYFSAWNLKKSEGTTNNDTFRCQRRRLRFLETWSKVPTIRIIRSASFRWLETRSWPNTFLFFFFLFFFSTCLKLSIHGTCFNSCLNFARDNSKVNGNWPNFRSVAMPARRSFRIVCIVCTLDVYCSLTLDAFLFEEKKKTTSANELLSTNWTLYSTTESSRQTARRAL